MSKLDIQIQKLSDHRPLLLAMEAIGWLHMAGKANADFLRKQGGMSNNYQDDHWFEYECPPFLWSDLLEWVKIKYPLNGTGNPWPSMTDFITKLKESNSGILGLLQAGHGMASGIEKNVPAKYLQQDATHMWLSSAFGHHVRNLISDPPEGLTEAGWVALVEQIRKILEGLKELGTNDAENEDVKRWWDWRENAIGTESILRRAFTSTVAETRIPNNDVTLWDQSYVAAALFKSAMAGAILAGTNFDWNNDRVKQNTCWRLLTVGISTDHYESRAVKIGDWKGAQQAIEKFFLKMRKLVEIDLACGSLLYKDTKVIVFSFPGEQESDPVIQSWTDYFEEQAGEIAREFDLETPPYCKISNLSRSLILLTLESQKAHQTLDVPVHRYWEIRNNTCPETKGHVCPVCLVRLNAQYNDKQEPCPVCYGRRHHRLKAWLRGDLDNDTIWIDEIADSNDRAALLTFSLDIEPWLDGTRIDSFRAQCISEWYLNNKKLARIIDNQIKDKRGRHNIERLLVAYFEKRIRVPPLDPSEDPIIPNMFVGAKKEDSPSSSNSIKSLEFLFSRMVVDRAHQVRWDSLSPLKNANWFIFQAFRKNSSPGRVHRFWRQTEAFFQDRQHEFREICARDPNRWRVHRLILIPDPTNPTDWEDNEIYNARWHDAPLELLYRQGKFLTVCNLARSFGPEKTKDELKGKTLNLRDDKGHEKALKIEDVRDDLGTLSIYHPIIPLDLSPLRFRVIVPLEVASECVDNVIAAWEDEFGRVWDRLPLRVGVVAFPRMMPFQAVTEATRRIEDELQERSERSEMWRIADSKDRDGVAALRLVREDHEQETNLVPVRLPDGRDDVFYPYLAVEDSSIHFARDFQHPDGQVYRHVKDLRTGDGVKVFPSLVATLFMENTAARFDPLDIRYLSDWKAMQNVWNIIQRTAPSQTALQGFWSDLEACRETWQNPDGSWPEGGELAWRNLAKTALSNQLMARGAALDMLADSARTGLLRRSLEWHLRVLKKSVRGKL